LVSNSVEANVEVIASATDSIAEINGFPDPFRMNQIGFGHVIPAILPSKRSKEGVRGPAAVDHERINGFSNLLEHVRTHK
jgi:hypothetical protein